MGTALAGRDRRDEAAAGAHRDGKGSAGADGGRTFAEGGVGVAVCDDGGAEAAGAEEPEVQHQVPRPTVAFDAGEVKASDPVQDYKRAWPLWREKALAQAKAERGNGAPNPPTQGGDSQVVELEFWRAIKDGNDADDFELYVRQFPNGMYAALAKRKIAKLRNE